jgi:subtilase family serine protease
MVSILLTAMILVDPTAAKAQGLTHQHIRWEQVDLIAGASPTATAKFGCEKRFFDPNLNGGRVPCYGPSAIRTAYGLNGLIDAGFNGTGGTIVILDAFGSPTAFHDLQAFDAVFGLPDPPSFNVVTMPGTPPFDPTSANQVGWAEEVSLDVQWAHAIAPGANIVLVAAASNSDADLIAGLNYAIDNHLGDVVSMSFGESEVFLTDDAGQLIVEAWDLAFRHARKSHITLFVSSGDQGSTNTADSAGDVFPFQNVSFPASSPRVTAVGGTNLYFGTGTPATGRADPNGPYILEKVLNDEPQGIALAGGGGVSSLFDMPDYQKEGLPSHVRKSLHEHRGLPDVAYNGGVVGGVVVHLGFPGIPTGFYVFGGTSAGAPQWAGVIADLNLVMGHPLGFINNRLYRRGKTGELAALFHDITVGDNGFCFFTTPNGAFGCVPGFSATPGWDLATGWGTPNFANLLTRRDDWEEDDSED